MRYIFSIILIILVIISDYNSYNDLKKSSTKEYCGKLIDKREDASIHKHGTTREQIFIMDFGQYGIHELDVTSNTYYKSNIGENICFDLYIARIEPVESMTLLDILGYMLSAMSTIAVFVYLLYLFIRYVLGFN